MARHGFPCWRPRTPTFRRSALIEPSLILLELILWFLTTPLRANASLNDARDQAALEVARAQATYYRHELNFWRHPIVPALATLMTALVAATVALRTQYQNKVEARLFETIKILGDKDHRMRAAAIELLRQIALKHPAQLQFTLNVLLAGLINEREPGMRASMLRALRDLVSRYSRALLPFLLRMNVIYRDLLKEAVVQYFVFSGAYKEPGDSNSLRFSQALSEIGRIARLDADAIWWLFQERLDHNTFKLHVDDQLRGFRSQNQDAQRVEQLSEQLHTSATSLRQSCELISNVVPRAPQPQNIPGIRQIIRLFWLVTLRPESGEPLRAPRFHRTFLIDCNFAEVVMHGWQFEDCVFYKTRFADAYLSGARFTEVNFVECDLRRVHFELHILVAGGAAQLHDVRFSKTILYQHKYSKGKSVLKSVHVPDMYVEGDQQFDSPENAEPWTYELKDGSIGPI
jgi:hypothetical protein